MRCVLPGDSFLVFVGRKHLVSIIFDLEKAYDISWKNLYFIRFIQNGHPFTNVYLCFFNLIVI